MHLFQGSRRSRLALVLAVHLAVLDAVPALCAPLPSRLADGTTLVSAREADLLAVQRTLEHELVARRLRDYGLSREEVAARLQRMPDQDLHQLAAYSHGLPAGGDAVGTLIGLLIVVLLVIVILKLLNKEIIVR